jgi:hypothetical protein
VSALRPVVSVTRAVIHRGDERDQDADRDGSHDPEHEPQHQRGGRDGATRHGGEHRALEHDQRGGVVEEAFALQHGEQPARHLHGSRHGLDGHRVGRRHHRTEGDGGGDPDARHQRRGGARHRGDRGHHERDGEERDAAPPRPEQRPRGALGRREEQRREEQRQDELRIEVEAVGQAGRERHADAQQQHERGPREPQPVTHADQQHRRQHQPYDEDQGLHRVSVSGGPRADGTQRRDAQLGVPKRTTHRCGGQAASASGP